MPYYEMFPQGIPASLKTEMNTVLNKKFGTTGQDYPTEDWPDDVNLLGLLEIKTASSASVCAFSDGADDVPSSSVKVTIPPTLSGVSSVSETQTGRNLFDTAIAETKTHNSVSITCDGNGKYTATGTATGGSANITFTLKTPCTIKSGMYLHLMNESANGSVSITLQKQDNTTIYAPALSPANRIADLSSYAGQTIYSIRFYVANGASFEMSLTPMLCFSSTATTFEPYQTPTQYTASLGRTIYGGTADIVNGTGTDENGNDFTFDGQEVPTRLGYNAFWSDSGDTEVTYRSSGTETIITPVLVTKTITENGTYNAADDSADGYSSVTVNIPSVPSGSHEDPLNGLSAVKYNTGMVFSGFYIDNGTLKTELAFESRPATGYEGFQIDLSNYNLVPGTNYEITFSLYVPNDISFNGAYPWGIKYSSTAITNPAGSSFNITPDVDFLEQTGTQSVTMQFTASSNNYLLVLFSRYANGTLGKVTILRDINISEVTP